ncbi:MAG: integrase arm-type DNA-binding domain-containing protein [Rhodospirillaceae bacterium]|jgi:integrase|nr:integrase arm-type DNA-binding domain-containing protein [Rhodospirillaceae bacterium]MBT5243207.1 integrase arm-type DNA-binding domain-containing protein [Rhodospirillaceae bacterium]MBT6243746.1 integrase arm-type DNA-binding domain-containing protein [Rhodospirillaceae bacterium]MBT7942813.1 integrase arm-type DNA-binding domain-containing protein [Alphaproteobacteria bacterium]
MPKIKLTNAAVERLKAPDAGQVDYYDATLPAFGLRVGRSRKMYFIIIRIHGKRSRITLGQAKVGDGPGISLKEARAKAGEVSEQTALGIDPRQTRAAEKTANRQRSENTFEAVADLYIERYAKKQKRTWREDKRIINVYLNPAWGDTPITDITRADVVRLLDDVEDAAAAKTGKGHYMANRVCACARKIFNWSIDERALLENNPIGRKMKRGVEGSRKRTFTDEEIKAIWSAADDIGGFKGGAVKMLMLTGQRLGVVAGMKHSEIVGDVWTISGDEVGRSKSKRDHLVAMSKQAKAVYETMPKIDGVDHVFSDGRRGDKAIAIGGKIRNMMTKEGAGSEWCFQNLRSLVATRMRSPLAVSPIIVDLVQGRIDNSVLSRHYDANEYVEEKRTALQAWANLLDEIVGDTDRDNVVPIKEAHDD